MIFLNCEFRNLIATFILLAKLYFDDEASIKRARKILLHNVENDGFGIAEP